MLFFLTFDYYESKLPAVLTHIQDDILKYIDASLEQPQ